jgi:hypothetical protein
MIWAKRHTCEIYLLNKLVAYLFSFHCISANKGE